MKILVPAVLAMVVLGTAARADRPLPSDGMTMAMTRAAVNHAKTVKGAVDVVPEPFAGGGGAAFSAGPIYGTVLAGNRSTVPYDLDQWMGGMLAQHQHLCGEGMVETFLDADDLTIKVPLVAGFTLDCPIEGRIRHTVGIVMEEDGLMLALTVHAEIASQDHAEIAPKIRREAERIGHTIAYYIGYGWPGPPNADPQSSSQEASQEASQDRPD